MTEKELEQLEFLNDKFLNECERVTNILNW